VRAFTFEPRAYIGIVAACSTALFIIAGGWPAAGHESEAPPENAPVGVEVDQAPEDANAMALATDAVADMPMLALADSPTPSAEVMRARVLELTNQERISRGLVPLTLNASLARAAQQYAEEMARSGCYSHTCGAQPDLGARFRQAGYLGWKLVAENIFLSPRTPEAAMSGWMDSAGHRANILLPELREIGVGLAFGPAPYWVQAFGARF
jgi:uncharacterized protein YkwD